MTSPLVASGAAAPAQAVVTAPVEVTVGGIPASTQPAVLVPGSVGLYQISVQIPAGVAPGLAVPLMILQQNAPSNIVTLAMQ